jgi:hypothetical protein
MSAFVVRYKTVDLGGVQVLISTTDEETPRLFRG